MFSVVSKSRRGKGDPVFSGCQFSTTYSMVCGFGFGFFVFHKKPNCLSSFESSLQSWYPHLWLWETKGDWECFEVPQVAFCIPQEDQGAALRDCKEIIRKSRLENIMSCDQECGCFAHFSTWRNP